MIIGCPFSCFPLVIRLSVILRFVVFDYTFGIFKLFLYFSDNLHIIDMHIIYYNASYQVC